MAAKKSETLEFTRRYLRDKPEATFAEIRDAAAERDMKIYPIVFGRAKALEGLVKVAPYGSKKRARAAEKAAAAESAGAATATGGVDSTAANVGTDAAEGDAGGSREGATNSIEAVISGMRENHAERERYRAALLKISEILDEIL